MRNLKVIFSVLFFFGLMHVNFAQRGKDGDRVVAGNVIVNEFTTLTADASVGDQTITVSNSSLNANGRFSTNLSGGDLLMIIQVQGAQIDATTNNISWGSVIDLNNCGNYELIQVNSVPNGSTINLDCPLKYDYTAAGKVQVVRVPRYNTLTVNSGSTITTDAWNGNVGGIVAIEVLGNTQINGTIDVSALGFRGGDLLDNDAWWAVTTYATPDQSKGAEKGEGIVGYQSDYDAFGGMYGRGAGANAGGGGNSHNSGGGGGANAGAITSWTGKGNPDISSAGYINAWELETAGFSGSTSSGGGRGGYSFSGNDLDATSVGPNDAAWGGDYRRSNGGLGGRPLDYTSTQIFMAGGGGAGDQNDDRGGIGGRGAGIVYLLTFEDVTGSGSILADGEDGYDSEDSFFAAGKEGAGGAGAGGTVIVNAIGSISGIGISATGGKGGNHVVGAFTNEMEGPGGGGGGGYVGVSNNGIIIDVSGGANGETNSSHGTEFTPNGATSGGGGVTDIDLANFDIVEVFDTICKGAQATITAQFQGIVPPGTSIEWYDAPFGGNQIQSGNTFVTSALFSDTIFYIGTCPGNYRQVYHVTIDPNAIADAGADTTTCIGVPIQLNGSGGVTYAWEPSNLVDDASQQSPIATPIVDTWFYLTITATNGCTDRDSVLVTLTDGLPVVASGDASICYGDSTVISASGATDYSWSPSQFVLDPTSNNTVAYPDADGWIYVLGSNSSGCTGEDSVFISVTNEITYTLSADTVICKNTCLDLSVNATGGSGSFSYNWDNGLGAGSLFTECLDTTTVYHVTITDNGTGCIIEDSVVVIVSDFNWSFSVDSTCTGYNTSFMDASTSSGGLMTAWDWNFGDSDGADFQDPTHVYDAPGDYMVSLEVTDEAGCSYLDSMNVTINPVPTGSISASTLEGCAPLSVDFSMNVADVDDLIWYSADTMFFDQSSFTYSFEPGAHDVWMYAETINGCGAVFNLSDSIRVYDYPEVYFTPEMVQETYFPGQSIVLLNQSDSLFSYEWNYGNGSSSSGYDGVVDYGQDGEYCVTLTVTNLNSCTNSYDTCLVVYETYEVIIPNMFTPNSDGVNDAFVIGGTEAYTYHVEIFNRWGNQLFVSEDYDNTWLGLTKSGDPLPSGTYYYYIYSNEDSTKVFKGFVTLLRN